MRVSGLGLRYLRFARQVSRRGDAFIGGCIAALALGERLLGPFLVHVATSAGVTMALAVGAVLSSLFAVRGWIQTAQVARTEAALYARVVDSVLRQDVLQPSVLPDEEARAALFEGGHVVASFVAEGLPNLCANVVAAAAFTIFVVVSEPPRIVAVAALSGAAGALLLAMSRRAIERARREESLAWVELADGVGNAFDGRLELVAGGRADAYAASFGEVVSSWSQATLRALRVSRLAGRLPLLALTVSVGAAVVLDAVVRGDPPARIMGQAAFLASMSPAFVGIAQGLHEIGRADRRLEQMAQLVAVPAVAHGGTKRVGDVVRFVELREVHFAYERGGRRREALSGASFSWHAGEFLAIAGANGAGKSTCLRVLLGLGKPAAGAVLIDGVPMSDLDMDLWRRRIAFVPQRPYLPPRATIRQCLRFIDSDVSDQTMAEAAERVELARVLQRDPASLLDSRVDELSVGQRQWVGLARLFCRQAPMILLDEPDANVDREGVQKIAGLVRELARDRMVLVATHSAELLAAADRVLVLEAGCLRRDSPPPPRLHGGGAP